VREQRLAIGDGSETTHSGKDDALAPQLASAVEHAWYWLEAKRVATSASESSASSVHSLTLVVRATASLRRARRFSAARITADNPLTVEGVALVENFFTIRLSGNGRQSCASCHAPDRAFSDRVALSRAPTGNPARAMPAADESRLQPAYAWTAASARA